MSLLHAGHGGPGPLVADPWSHGTGIMRAVLARLNWTTADLDFTHVGSLIAIVGAAPAGWRILRRAWHEVYGWVRQFFLASVTIPGGDPVNKNLVKWLVANRPRQHRTFTGRTEMGRGDVTDRAAALKKTRRAVQYAPHWDSRWFWYEGRLFVATRDNFSSSAMSDPAYDGVGGEELTVSCLGRSIEPVQNLIEVAREFADRQTQYFVIIYGRDRYGMTWQPKSRKPIRLLDTVHFDDRLKKDLLDDIRKYLDPRTQRRYESRSMPYRRGYLFYGPPGTGKSSLSTALAGEFGLDLYEVKVPSIASDSDLEQMFHEIPPRCIVLLEDIDAVWVDRSSRSRSPDRRSEHSSGSGSRSGHHRSNCTLSGLLNVLDGVGSQEGRIVIMTTNKPDSLDPALVRPGRVDMKVFLGHISPQSAEQMFVRMFSPDELVNDGPVVDMDRIRELAQQFAQAIPDDVFTPSQLQGYFQLHLDSADDATAGIASWVAKETSRQADGGFEVVITGSERAM
ncbi:putative mitochondrial chaperone bcs1 [Microdochium trichocladiopsis]|uniref:Mitochondrial chaperone bcs1 n=1 Tax=Microdochium trichocladiopsis TaxID=1682393 RepID=A0A9P8Y9N7_9PEZI|nr:putative mitochondrial chaperone bcs1 [Microdochium trichocladiopsis]KAH7031334.1 putative mitochondrial chaperone bcs1 [Microdochium trichocladiopsis]